MIEVQKNIAMAGGFLTLAVFGPAPGRSTAGAGGLASAFDADHEIHEPRQPE